jgi:hypothetical protein
MDRVLQALLRTELLFIQKVFTTVSPGETYLHNWHVDAIAHQLMRVRSGESRRLLINQPPRSLKSICVSVAYRLRRQSIAGSKNQRDSAIHAASTSAAGPRRS